MVWRSGNLRLICIGFALTLCGFNYSGIIGGWLNVPEGYEPAYLNRGTDFAQYLTWAKASESQVLIPNYHAPFATEPALFNPLLLVLSRIALLAGIEFAHLYVLAHVLAYALCGFGLYRSLSVFLNSFREALLALALMMLSIPLSSLLTAPRFLRNGAVSPMRQFLYTSSDGFIHGMPGSLLVTVSTAIVLLAFAAMGRYIQTQERAELRKACLLIALVTFLHPFEVFVLVAASGAALLLCQRSRKAVWDCFFIGLAGLCGLLPYAAIALTEPWVAEAARLNRWNPGNPIRLIASLGLPTIAVLGLLVPARRRLKHADVLLVAWMLSTLVLVYVPFIPWSQHLFDGYHCATGMLLARLAGESPAIGIRRWVGDRLVMTGAAVLLLLSLGAYAVYWRTAYRNGSAVEPRNHFHTIRPKKEAALIDWLRQNTSPDELLVAPLEYAPWVAATPIHSLASHYLFSLTFENQAAFSVAFYDGQLKPEEAERRLAEFGVRYVVALEKSDVSKYLAKAKIRWKREDLTVYDFGPRSMAPYSIRR